MEIELHCIQQRCRGRRRSNHTFLHGCAARWLSSYFQKPGLKERGGEVLPMVVLAGLDTWDLFLASLPGPSGHAWAFHTFPHNM